MTSEELSLNRFNNLLKSRGITLQFISAVNKDDIDEKGKNRVDKQVQCPHCKRPHKVIVGSKHDFTEMVMGLKFKINDELKSAQNIIDKS